MSLVWRSPTCSLYRGPILEVLNAIGIEIFGPRAVSSVERSITPCPYLRGSTIRGSTVLYIVVYVSRCSPQ